MPQKRKFTWKKKEEKKGPQCKMLARVHHYKPRFQCFSRRRRWYSPDPLPLPKQDIQGFLSIVIESPN